MPPRLECLNAARMIKQEGGLLKSISWTATRTFADRSSASDDLLSIGEDSTPQTQFPFPSRHNRPGQAPNESNRRVPFSARERNQPGNANATERVLNLMNQTAQRNARTQAQRPALSTAEELAKSRLASSLSKQIGRRWRAGDVYAPHDLSPEEVRKWKKRSSPIFDSFDMLDMNPIEEYKNFSIMSEYMSPMGRILHKNNTGLRAVNQRRISKAIRRSIGLGLMPSVHKHPEILLKQVIRRNEQLSSVSRQY